MSDVATRIAASWETIQWICRFLVPALLGLVVWVMKEGGVRALRESLAELHAPQRVEAKEQIKSGLKLAGAVEPHDEEDQADALIRGIDQWRTVSARQERRLRGLRWCKWLACALLVLSVVLALPWHPDSSWFGGALLLVWAGLAVTFVIQAAPIFLLLLDHGVPKRSEPTPEPAAPQQPGPRIQADEDPVERHEEEEPNDDEPETAATPKAKATRGA